MENTKKIQNLLMNAIFEVFEKMFFVFLEPLEEEVRYDMTTTIKFSGPVKGSIEVFFRRGVAEAMVQNMLGIDEHGVTDKLIEDCTKEAVNMISGNFLQKYDSTKVFDLSIPEFEEKEGTFALQENDPSYSVWNLSFESDGNLIGVRMHLLQ
jgi:CheY-specific phosphatase CheX